MLLTISRRLIAWVMARPDPSTLERWHQITCLSCVTLRDGGWSQAGGGQIWRGRVGSRWEYEQDDGFEAGVDDLRGDDWN